MSISSESNELLDYWKFIESLPEDFRKIHEELWDYTGRPNFVDTYVRALGYLMQISNNWDEFIANFKILFPSTNVHDSKVNNDLTTCWRCYLHGVKRGDAGATVTACSK